MTTITLTLRKPGAAECLMHRAALSAVIDAADAIYGLGDSAERDECAYAVEDIESALHTAAIGLCMGVPLRDADLVEYGQMIGGMLADGGVEPAEVGRLAGAAGRLIRGQPESAPEPSEEPAPALTRPEPQEPPSAKPAPIPMGNPAPCDDPDLVPPPVAGMGTADTATWQSARWAPPGEPGDRARAAWRFRRREILQEREPPCYTCGKKPAPHPAVYLHRDGETEETIHYCAKCAAPASSAPDDREIPF